jgi:hypothetical protein
MTSPFSVIVSNKLICLARFAMNESFFAALFELLKLTNQKCK